MSMATVKPRSKRSL